MLQENGKSSVNIRIPYNEWIMYLKNSEPEDCATRFLEVALDEIEALRKESPGGEDRYSAQVIDLPIGSRAQGEEQKQRDDNPNQRGSKVEAVTLYHCSR